MKQDARSMKQEATYKLQATRESLAFVQAFMAETQPLAGDDTQDQVSLTQIVERAVEPNAEPSPDMLRRLITRVREVCLA